MHAMGEYLAVIGHLKQLLGIRYLSLRLKWLDWQRRGGERIR